MMANHLKTASVNFARCFALHLSRCSCFPAKSKFCWHVWCSLWSHWGFTQSHCLSWWLFNPRLTGNHLHNQDAWYCEKWRLKHPLAQQDVLCFQQSDGPNWTISSSMETGYSFRLTVCSSLEHRNPHIYIYIYIIFIKSSFKLYQAETWVHMPGFSFPSPARPMGMKPRTRTQKKVKSATKFPYYFR